MCDAGDSGNLSSPAATLVPAIPLLLVAARLTAEEVSLACEDDEAMEDEEEDEDAEEPQQVNRGPTATIATVDGCAFSLLLDLHQLVAAHFQNAPTTCI